MLSTRTLKGFIFGFLLVLAGGLVYIGTAPLSDNSGDATVAVIALIVMFFGLLIALVACGL